MWWSFASSCHRWRVEMSGMWVHKETLRGEDHDHDNAADFHDFHFDFHDFHFDFCDDNEDFHDD